MTIQDLKIFGNTPFNYTEFQPTISEYRAQKNKVRDLEKQGCLVRLKKGYYVASSACSGMPIVPELVANHLYSPSYVSLTTALRHYGLIPERVFAVKSVTCKRSSHFSNTTGEYYYTSVPSDYYPIGITIGNVLNTNFLIATPEKALCDQIITTRNLRLRSLRELRQYLEEDLRLDMDCFMEMDSAIFLQCAAVSPKKQTILNLAKLLKT